MRTDDQDNAGGTDARHIRPSRLLTPCAEPATASSHS